MAKGNGSKSIDLEAVQDDSFALNNPARQSSGIQLSEKFEIKYA